MGGAINEKDGQGLREWGVEEGVCRSAREIWGLLRECRPCKPHYDCLGALRSYAGPFNALIMIPRTSLTPKPNSLN